jgi:hypothetical protein
MKQKIKTSINTNKIAPDVAPQSQELHLYLDVVSESRDMGNFFISSDAEKYNNIIKKIRIEPYQNFHQTFFLSEYRYNEKIMNDYNFDQCHNRGTLYYYIYIYILHNVST